MPFPTYVLILIGLSSLLTLESPAQSSEPDKDALALIDELQLDQTSAPIRDSANWKKPNKVLVYLPENRKPVREDFVSWMKAAAGEAELIVAETRAALEDEKKNIDVLLGHCSDVTLDMWNLRWVQNYFVGVDRCVDNKLLIEEDVLLTNTKAVPGPGMAEHAMAMVLMLTHKMNIYYRQQLNANWQRIADPYTRVVEIKDKTMLVVGLGGIGRQIAKRAHSLGMRVIAARKSSRRGPDYVEYVGLADELMRLTKEADVIVNVTPLTKETRGLFDHAFFKAMKPSAYFINIGRGKSVHTKDLMNALKNGELAGAGLDVTDPEPLPADHPLWRYPNVIITPHSSSPSDRMLHRFWTLVRENLRRYTAGERMLNVVDLRRGY